MTTDPRDDSQEGDEAESGLDLVQSIELLSQMIDRNEEALRADAQRDAEDPDRAEEHWYRATTLPGAEAQRTFDEIFDAPAEDLWEGVSSSADTEMESGSGDDEALKQELIAELRAIIDAGLHRVTETARQALASEFAAHGAVSVQNQDEPAAPVPGRLPQTLSAKWDRLKPGETAGGILFSTLQREVEEILHDGLEQIRRNLESAVQSVISAHMDSGSPASPAGEPGIRPRTPGDVDTDGTS